MKFTPSPVISEASGKAAGVVASRWKGRLYFRALVTPANPQSAAQVAVRASMTELVRLWQLMSATLHTAYNAGAAPKNLSGYNDFCSRSRATLQATTGLYGPRVNPKATSPALIAPQDMSAPTPGDAKLDFTWSDPGQGATYHMGFLIYNTTDDLFVEESLQDVLMSAEALSIDGLTNGKLYVGCTMVSRDTDDECLHVSAFAGTPAA